MKHNTGNRCEFAGCVILETLLYNGFFGLLYILKIYT